MNTKENDYSLLREFNLGQAQAGDEILSVLSPSYSYKEVVHEVKFKGVTSNLKEVFVEDEQGEGYCRSSGRVKMKPLCWIEGKPVYKGDKFWYKSKADNTYYQQEAWSISGERLFDEGSFGFVDISLLTWDKPKEPTKKSGWINLWKPICNRHPNCLTVDNTVCSTKDVALVFARWYPDEYITTIEIHWEE